MAHSRDVVVVARVVGGDFYRIYLEVERYANDPEHRIDRVYDVNRSHVTLVEHTDGRVIAYIRPGAAGSAGL